MEKQSANSLRVNNLSYSADNCRIGAVLNGFFPHHLDHLAPLCYYLDCPLLVDDPDILSLAKKYYPQIQTFLKKINIFNASNEFELLIFTSTKPPIELKAMINATNNSNLRIAYAPHGYSNKGDLSKRLVNHEGQDIALIHGAEQLRQLKQYGIDKEVKSLVTIGNPRRHFYNEHNRFYDRMLEPYQSKRKSILFAPTFDDGYCTSSFKHTHDLIEALAETHQLIIKLHPLTKQQNLIEVTKLEERLKSIPHVHFFCDQMPLVCPFIEYADVYLGDFSSIGFEFAVSQKPLFLFESAAKSQLAPLATLVKNSKDLLEKLKNPPKSYSFKKMNLQIFSHVDPKLIRQRLIKALNI